MNIHQMIFVGTVFSTSPILFTSAPNNFLWLGRNGTTAYILVVAFMIFGPVCLWIDVAEWPLSIVLYLTSIVLVALAIGCLFFEQAFNLRYKLWCQLTGKIPDPIKVNREFFENEQYYRKKYAHLLDSGESSEEHNEAK